MHLFCNLFVYKVVLKVYKVVYEVYRVAVNCCVCAFAGYKTGCARPKIPDGGRLYIIYKYIV